MFYCEFREIVLSTSFTELLRFLISIHGIFKKVLKLSARFKV